MAVGKEREGLVRRERNSPGSQPPHRVTGGLLGGRRTKPGSQTPPEPAGGGVRSGQKPSKNPRKADKTPSRKRKNGDCTGLEEMQRLMRTWSGRKREREMEEKTEVEELVVDKPGEKLKKVDVKNTVETIIRKFDKPGTDLGSSSDFVSWKKRRTCLTLTVDLDQGLRVDSDLVLDHGLRGGGEQVVGSDVKHDIEHPHGVSEMGASGLTLNSNIVTNHNHCSNYGGKTGVQRDGGGQGDGGVIPVQFSNMKQRDPRTVGSFSESGSTPDNAAATEGKPV